MGILERLKHSRAVWQFYQLLRQGTSAHELSLTIVLGFTLGTIPVFGFITALCVAIALWLKLNVPLAVGVLYMVMPLQILLFIPFIRLGEFLFSIPQLPLAPDTIIAQVQTQPWLFMLQIGNSVLGALGAWALASLLGGVAMYYLSYYLIRRYRK